MCGIAGQVNWGGIKEDAHVAGIIGRMRHRGPDASGQWRSPNGCCVLGHARLSVIDLSNAANQPMQDPLTGNVIVFNGEIYNFQERRRECEDRGDRFISNSDTEVILALYRRYGIDCLKYLRGMFAFAIWDVSQQKLFMARDRVGKKPLNFALVTGGLIFSSEIDPLANHPSVSSDLDEDALELYLQLKYIPAPWSIYRSIRKLPPAHYGVYDRNGLSINQYWNIDYRPKLQITEQDALDGLKEKLKEAIKLRMIADVPLGALLSGGVDSSLIVALMADMSEKPVKTFTIGFEEEAFNELSYAQSVADIYATDHSPVILSSQVEPMIEPIVRHYGEPFADSSAVPSFLVCRAARKEVTVALNGDGGDELLGGYTRYCLTGNRIKYGKLFGNLLSPHMLSILSRTNASRTLPEKIFRRLCLRMTNPELKSILVYDACWNDAYRSRVMGRAACHGNSVLDSWRKEYLRESARLADNPVDRMLVMDNKTYLAGDLLVKMDIASMHCGLEARSPLLDQEVIEFCASLPVKFKVHKRSGKYLLKKLASRYIPDNLIDRPKMGFAIPLADWLRGPLKPMIEEVLGDRDLMDPLDLQTIRSVKSAFFTDSPIHASRIWALLMFGKWNEMRRSGGDK